MSATPTIAVLYKLPLLPEALRHALLAVGEVRAFESPSGDPRPLLDALAPDVVIVDSERDADAALAYARATGCPALYIPWPELGLRTATPSGWEQVDAELSPELVATYVSGALRTQVAS